MKRNCILVAAHILFVVFLTGDVLAQCDPERPNGEALRKISVDQKTNVEKELRITASVPGTSWKNKGSEAAVLSVFVDGRYSQDVVLFAGAEKVDYRSLLGNLGRGKHTVEIFLNKDRSAAGADKVTISYAKSAAVKALDPVDGLAIANSPILYVRPDAVDRFSDIPLVTYYEIFPSSKTAGRIRYTAIFTNEDGGTQTAALMARWGRATDIEWVTEFEYKDGKIANEIYQGANHQTKTFAGERVFGSHPLMLTTTVNNNFADRGCSKLKIANVPVRVDLTNRTRETVMDDNPWTHRIMAEEALREGRIDPTRMGANVIDDPRNYLYVDIYTENTDSAVSIEITTFEGSSSLSDLGDPKLRVAKSGHQRIAVRRPDGRNIREIRLRCHSIVEENSRALCGNTTINKLISLDEWYRPVISANRSERKTIRSGESNVWTPPT